jgi:O-antigen/teichoic acid export membrane protein
MKTNELLRKWATSGSFASHAAVTAGANIILAMLGTASGVFAARLLGPSGRGELAAIQTWPSFVASIALLGMPEAVVYYSAREPSEAGRYVGSAAAIGFLCAGPFMLFGYLLMPMMLHSQNAAIISGGRWYLLLTLIYIFTVIPISALRGRADFVIWNAMRVTPGVIWLLVLFAGWAFNRAAPVFLAGANLAGLAILAFPFAGVIKYWLSGSFLPERRKCLSMLRYGFPCMLTGVPQTANLRLDQVLMSALLPPRDLGLYVVAVAWSGVTAPLLNALSAVTTPAVASVLVTHGVQRLAAATRATVTLAIALCIILAVITPIAIVVLFGARFTGSIAAAFVLLPAGGVLGVNLVIEEGLRGLGQPYAVLQAELAGLVVTVLALAAMLLRLGIMGAAIASLIGYSTVTITLALNVYRYTRLRPSQLFLFKLSQYLPAA